MIRTAQKHRRLELLQELLRENPFLTDGELSENLNVSIQTIRLDRLNLGIPELRERVKQVAENATHKLKSISGGELVGELLDLELGNQAISLLEVTAEMVFRKTGVVRGHHLFAQANSLAVAVIDAEVALTGTARVKFKRQVRLGERVVAKAQVISGTESRFRVAVRSTVNGEEVCTGKFVIFARGPEEEANDAHSP